ncbi:magnesium/cobalt transporter CorA [Paenibacillus psychroresistens]|uniref:Magnesium transport protein CorA n=1 Tax=Paenibacillus psychroresistens TaxID=1778678 RepID=A0A6B8RX51_9BACL|nr:magnesium/cobalt transporter CorA [Paenibacillus psychroresistens]QGR00275.1 magnesium/cobalt transporter CorA [Paenibacillus psychroresistens]
MLIYNSTNQKITEEDVRAPLEAEVVWIRMLKPSPEEVKHVLGETFKCHPLLVEDCINMKQRPKMDRYKNQTYLSFYAVHPKNMTPIEMAIVIGKNYLITIYYEEITFLDELHQEFQQFDNRMDNSGAILYHLLDRCVDEYTLLVDHVEDKVDKMERGIFRNPYIRIAKDIFHLKRLLHQVRRYMAEEKIIMGAICHQNLPFMSNEADVYFIDIYDHISRVVDSLDSYRESLTGLLELQMGMKSDRMNEIMKTLTIISSIFLPLTFIVGLYGMNFRVMPELDWAYSYPIVICVMFVITALMVIYYKRKKWM